MLGGLLADKVDRKKFLIVLSVEQLVFSLGLAWVVRSPSPSHVLLVLMVVMVGVGSAMFGPAYSAILPALVGREDLPGAISLNSAQMNASRVIGPIIGRRGLPLRRPGLGLRRQRGTYLFVVAALMVVTLPAAAPGPRQHGGPLARAVGGHHHRPGRPRRGALPGHRLRVLAAGPGLHRPDAGGGGTQPGHQSQVDQLRASSMPASAPARSSAPSPSARSSPGPPKPMIVRVCLFGYALALDRLRPVTPGHCRPTSWWPWWAPSTSPSSPP